MTELRLKNVVAFSSEDKVYTAQGLLDGGKKWLGDKNGESKNHVIIQLEKPSEIRQINIENDSSAFIEIHVANKCESDDDFSKILAAVSFMSPLESKTKTNATRVKIFTDKTNLVKDVASSKWEYVKVICSQPFNTDLQFGISSIKFYDQIVVNDELIEAAKIKPGIFSIKKDLSVLEPASDKSEPAAATSTDSADAAPKTSSIFQKWKNSEASKTDSKSTKDETEDAAESTSSKRKSEEDESPTHKKPERAVDEKPVGSNNLSPDKSKTYFKPREQTLKGVIFALSGFQNPLRSELRDAGMKLGAKYRPDWTDDCTHLICAFANTPKGNVAKKAGGKIVTKEWILDCAKQKSHLDWEAYQFDNDDSSDSDSDTTKPRRAAKNASKRINKIADALYDSYDEDAENSDDRDFVVNSSDEEDARDVKIADDSDSDSDETTSTPDSDDSEGASKRKKTKKKTKKDKKNPAKKAKKEVKVKSKKPASPRKAKNDSDSDDDELEAYRKLKEKEAIRKKLQEMREKEGKAKKSADSDDEKGTRAQNGKPNPLDTKKKNIDYGDDDDDDGKKKAKPAKLDKKASVSSNKTEVNSDLDEDSKENAADEWQLPSFFADKTFYLYGDFDPKRSKDVSRVIVAFAGSVSNYLNDEVNYVISDKAWNKEFEKGLEENKNIKFISSDWIDACSRRKKLIAYQPFEITPK